MAYIFSAIALIAAYLLGGFHGLCIAGLLGILEISLSFDNAVVNASVLKDMSAKWQKRFLTWGIAIAVFGMRLVFPVLIVAAVSGNSLFDVVDMAVNDQETYKANLISSHALIAAFGGTFLLMIFLKYFSDKEKALHWLGVEKFLKKIPFCEIRLLTAMAGFFAVVSLVREEVNPVAIAALIGCLTYVAIKHFADKFGNEDSTNSCVRAGFSSFIYLEVLDASFSLDGVVGAFAISKEIFIIMLGLGIGAVFIRSMTIAMVKNKTLEEYIYLEHGAHYGIGALGLLMLLSINFEIPEIITGLIGVGFIGASLISSKNAK